MHLRIRCCKKITDNSLSDDSNRALTGHWGYSLGKKEYERDIKAAGKVRGWGWRTPEVTEFRSTEGRRILLGISHTLRKGHKRPLERNWRRLKNDWRERSCSLTHREDISLPGRPTIEIPGYWKSCHARSLSLVYTDKHHYHQPNGRGFDLILNRYEPHCTEINLGDEKEKT